MAWIIIASIALLVVSVICTNKSCMPSWARDLCGSCGSDKVRWLRGQESSSMGEAKFFCKACGHSEHRGGRVSELAMQNWEARK
jgi:hypothetical protein